MDEAAIRKRCEELVTHYYCEDPWYSCPKAEDGCANDAAGTECDCGYEGRVQKLIALYADGQRDGMEECKRLISTHHAPFHWYFEWLVKKINAKLDEIRQAAGEVTGG